jgi:hypothetical protein
MQWRTRIERPSGKFLRTYSTTELKYTYTLDFGDADGLVGRILTVRVKGRNIKGTSEDASILVVTIPERAAEVINLTADTLLLNASQDGVRADAT